MCPENPALRLLSEGGPGMVFNVADPTSDGYARPQILFPAYVSGRTLAESAYLATRYLSWRQVVVGDPLTAVAVPEVVGSAWSDATDPATGGPKFFAERRRALLRALYPTSDAVVTLLMRAEFAEAHDRPEEALELVSESLERDPAVWDSAWLRAQLLDRLGRFEAAAAAYRQALDLASKATATSRPAVDEGALRRRLAELDLNRLDRPDRAEAQVQWLLDHRGTGDPEAAALWTEVKLRLGKFDEAEALLLRLVRQQDPAPAFVLEGLGDIAASRRDEETANRYYRRALDAPEADTSRIEGKLERLATAAAAAPATAPGEGIEGTAVTDASSATPTGGIASESHPARIVERRPIEYPAQAVKEGIEGIVSLRLLIDERGQLVKIERVHGKTILLLGAEKGVRTWTFAPKLVDGKAVPDWIDVSIRFEVKKK